MESVSINLVRTRTALDGRGLIPYLYSLNNINSIPSALVLLVQRLQTVSMHLCILYTINNILCNKRHPAQCEPRKKAIHTYENTYKTWMIR